MPPFDGNHSKFISDVISGSGAVRLHEHLSVFEEVKCMIPVGGIYLSTTVTNPSSAQMAGGLGYGVWSRFGSGRCIVGVDENDSDFNSSESTAGSKTVTPTGSVSQPEFTGTVAQSTSAASAGTPAGTVSQPTFTGSALPTHTHTFTGVALANHAHELPLQLVSGTSTRHLPAATFGTGTSRAAQGADTATANTTSAAVALSQAVSAGTPSGTNASITAGTPSGVVSQPTFTGSAMPNHSHSVTPSGTVSTPTFSGNSISVVQPSIAVYMWKRIS